MLIATRLAVDCIEQQHDLPRTNDQREREREKREKERGLVSRQSLRHKPIGTRRERERERVWYRDRD